MQYKTITAAFALFVGASMAIPATDSADVAAVQARGEEGLVEDLLNDVGHIVKDVLHDLGLYDDVTRWKTYTDDDGTPCEPYSDKYNYAFAYEYKFCYTVDTDDDKDDDDDDDKDHDKDDDDDDDKDHDKDEDNDNDDDDDCDTDCPLGGRKYPKCTTKWYAYTDENGKTCQPYTKAYSYDVAYKNDCYD